uniref:Uncharacterized protein n=1 Tax=Arundo donax TaxID=35708 RepID=A0A0A9G025_ARUDO
MDAWPTFFKFSSTKIMSTCKLPNQPWALGLYRTGLSFAT